MGAARKPSHLIRAQTCFLQVASELFQTLVPDGVELPLRAAQERRDRGYAEAFPVMELEEQAILGWKRLEEGSEQLAEPALDAGAFTVLDPAFNLPIDRDPEQLLFADPSPLRAPAKRDRHPFELGPGEGDSVLGPHPLDRLVEGESVADTEPLQEHRLRGSPEGCRGGPPFTPEVNAIIPYQIHQHDGQEGGEGAPAFPTREDAVIVLDKLEQGPGAELLGLVLGKAATPAQVIEPLADQAEVLFEERSPAGRRDSREAYGAGAGKGLTIDRDFSELARHLRTSRCRPQGAALFRRPDSSAGALAVLWKSFRKTQETHPSG